MAVNNSVVNLLMPTTAKGVEVQRSASTEHAPADQPRFSDTLKTIEQSAVAERTKRAEAKVQKSRDAQNELQQKRLEQKSKSNISAQNSSKNTEQPATRADKSDNISRSNSEIKKISKDSDDAVVESNCEPADEDATGIDETTQKDVAVSVTTEVSLNKNESPSITDAVSLLTQEIDSAASSGETTGELPKGDASSHPNLVSGTLSVADELQSASVHSKLESQSLTDNTTGLVGNHVSESLKKEPSIKKGKDQILSTDEDLTLDQNISLLDTSGQDAALTEVQSGAQLNTPTVAFGQTLTDGGDKAENVLDEIVKMTTNFSTTNSPAHNLVNQTATSNKMNGDATASAAGLLSSDETEIFKSIIGEMKTENSASSDTMDLLSTLDLPLPDANKSTTSTSFFSGLQNALSSEASARGFVVKAAVEVPVGQPQWSQAVGDKVLWLAAQNVTSAELHLHPEDLGPMQVKVSIGQDQMTQVSFTSQHAQVREILDQNLQRLKDMFAEQGMHSVQVDVSDRSSREQTQEQRPKFSQAAKGDQEDEAVVAISAIQIKRLVDHYA